MVILGLAMTELLFPLDHASPVDDASSRAPAVARARPDHVARGKSVNLPASHRAAPAGATATATATPTAAVPPAPLTPVTQTISVGGVARAYHVYASPAVTGKVPALVVLEGGYATVATEEARDGLIRFAEAGKAVLVYPFDTAESWNAGACCGQAQATHVDDVGFITTLVGALAAQPDIGPVYLIGYSNGGKLAFDVVCSDPGLVRGFAVIAASPVVACPGGAPVSLLAIDGTKDPIQAYDDAGPQHVTNGFKEPSVTDEVAAWVNRDGCSGRPAAVTMGTLVLEGWSPCSAGTVVQLGSYQGGQHEWPAGSPGTPSAADAIWAFFTQVIPAQAQSPPAPAPPPGLATGPGVTATPAPGPAGA